MDNFNLPLRIFYANLLYLGVTLHVEQGRLCVGGGKSKALSPAYREEIIKRKEGLIEMLSQTPPAELAPYFGRLIRVEEVPAAQLVADVCDVKVRATPVDGGWLLEMAKDG